MNEMTDDSIQSPFTIAHDNVLSVREEAEKGFRRVIILFQTHWREHNIALTSLPLPTSVSNHIQMYEINLFFDNVQRSIIQCHQGTKTASLRQAHDSRQPMPQYKHTQFPETSTWLSLREHKNWQTSLNARRIAGPFILHRGYTQRGKSVKPALLSMFGLWRIRACATQ